VRVIVAFYACDLSTQPLRAGKLLVHCAKLYLGDGKTLVIAIELIDLEDVIAASDKVSCLVDDAPVAQLYQFPGLAGRYLLLPLKTAQSTVK
jgi:hypothetical protein